jgi:hypothetical protein
VRGERRPPQLSPQFPILAVALALMADRALAAGPQMPDDFSGYWCASSDFPKDAWAAYQVKEGGDCGDWSSVEITATGVKSPALSMFCVIRKVTKFDVCPWGMIFRNRKRAQALRSFQINPWSPGYHIVLQCTGGPKRSEMIGADWVIEKGSIRAGVPREYRCPWDRRTEASQAALTNLWRKRTRIGSERLSGVGPPWW